MQFSFFFSSARVQKQLLLLVVVVPNFPKQIPKDLSSSIKFITMLL